MTREELDEAALADLICDAVVSERHAADADEPRRGMLLAYAARCRAAAERYKDGGAHDAVVKGRV